MKMTSRFSEIAKRYAVAIYDIAAETKSEDKILGELQKVTEIFSAKEIRPFTVSPLIKGDKKEAVVKAAIAGAGLSKDLESLLLLLAQRERLSLLGEIVSAYRARSDERNGITRGDVRSVTALSDSQRKEIETLVGQATRKKVVLNFEEDKNIVGGVVAQVGSLSLDDSLASHLRRIEENLNRRMN